MANLRDLKYYQDMTEDAIERDKVRDAYFEKFKKIMAVDWDLPPELDALPWIRTVKTSGPTDGMDAAVRTFSTVMPTIHVHASMPTEVERKRVETIEDALKYHFMKANLRGTKSPLSLINQSVVEYGCVGMQVRYIPYDFPHDKSARVKAMRRQGDFVYIIHDPITVHPLIGDFGLEAVSVAKLRSVADLAREFGRENTAIKKIVSKMISKGESEAEWEETYVSYYDVCDYENRARWVSLEGTALDTSGGDKSSIEISRAEHKLPFMPFIYREGRKPILQTLVDSNAWEDQNVLKSLQIALLIATVAQPRSTTYTFNGEGLDVDYQEPGAQVRAHVGEEFRVNPPPQTDPNLEAQVRAGEAAITQTMQTRALQSASEIASSAPFATYNAILQTAIGSLAGQRQVAEAALSDAMTQQLEWINHSKIPLVANRMRSRKGASVDRSLAQDAQIMIGPDSPVQFDPDTTLIVVKLRADTPTDEQTRMNKATVLVRDLKFSVDDALEASGLDELERNTQSWMDEQFGTALLNSKIQEIMGDTQLKLQAKGMQMQMQAQQAQMQAAQQAQGGGDAQQTPEQQAQDANQGAAFQNANGPMYNPAEGGASPYQAAPNMTREAINGTDSGGQEIQR